MNKRMMTSRKLCHVFAVLIITFFTATVSAQVKGEYFWNQDPGVGKATPTGAASADGEYSTFDIASDKIPAGMNILGLRAFSGGRWTHTVTYFVFVPAQPTAADWRVEYFWDSDPGMGMAIPIPAALVQDGGTVITDISTEGLTPGEHLIGFRSCSGHGWSQTVTSTVFVSDPRQYTITGAEYFWGEDPGFGNGTAIKLTPGKEVTVADLTIDFPKEKADEYVLNIRARSERGWGLTHTTVIPHLYVETIELSAESDWLEAGTTMKVSAMISPADAFCDELEWSSSDTEVATVAPDGTVTGIAPGEVTITARATDGSSATASIDLAVMSHVISGINEILNNDEKYEIYNLTGIKVGDSLDNLQPGFYIVRQGTTVKKIAID